MAKIAENPSFSRENEVILYFLDGNFEVLKYNHLTTFKKVRKC